MKTKPQLINAIFLVVLTAFAHRSMAADFSAAELNHRIIERRAVEAVIWGMPAVNYDLMLQEMLNKTQGKTNEILYWSRPLDWKNQTLTPNPDSIYLMSFYDTKDVGQWSSRFRRPMAGRWLATSSTSGRCRWKTPALRAQTKARAASI